MIRPFLLLAALLLAGCAVQPVPSAVPPEPPAAYGKHLRTVAGVHAFSLHGRIAVLTREKSFSGTLHWQHHADGDEIGLYTPVGTQLGQISAHPGNITFTTSNNKTHQAEDAESLIRRILGWSLPMSGLPDWVLGRPGAGEAHIQAWDEDGHIRHMRQHGWVIEYAQYRETANIQLPGKIVLKSPELDLKLVIEQWADLRGEEP